MKHSKKIVIILTLIFVILTSFSTQNRYSNSVHGQTGEKGYFEGEVPLNGAYLQAINCDPRFSVDKDDNGILDPGYTRDFDGDGVPETKYVEDPLIVNLAENGFYPGDIIMISRKSCIRDAIYDSAWGLPLFGLFSSSSELTTKSWNYSPKEASAPLQGDKKWPIIGPEHRVPGAIDAALGGYFHLPGDDTNTWKLGLEVEHDIPEDFRITGYAEWNSGKNGVKWSPDTWFFTNGFWITIPAGAKYLFFQITGYWLLNHDGYCTVTIDKDTDKDAIPDSWEKRGIDFNKDDEIDLLLKNANFERKDIYVEIDYMSSSGTCIGHKPEAAALSAVEIAFKESPVENPDNYLGIAAHFDIEDEDEIPHQDAIKAWDDFDNLKKTWFGSEDQRENENSKWILLAKKYTYHYCMFIHQFSKFDPESGIWKASDAAGKAEVLGNDFMVSLGTPDIDPETVDEQAAVFMHELGHNLGLQHGGCDDINYKPNYLSVMNYMFLYNNDPISRPLDYSRLALPNWDENAALNENELDELNGLGVNGVNTYSQPWYQTVYSVSENATTPVEQVQLTLLMPIDWNNDTNIEPDVKRNINNFPYWDYYSPEGETLRGWDDWAHLNFYFQFSGDFADGAHLSDPDQEITWEIAKKIKEVFKQLEPFPIPDIESDSSSDTTSDSTGLPMEVIIPVALVSVILILLGIFLFWKKRR